MLVKLSIIPSTSMILVVLRTYSSGFINACTVVAGIIWGLFFVFFASLGMANLAQEIGSLFLIRFGW